MLVYSQKLMSARYGLAGGFDVDDNSIVLVEILRFVSLATRLPCKNTGDNYQHVCMCFVLGSMFGMDVAIRATTHFPPI